MRRVLCGLVLAMGWAARVDAQWVPDQGSSTGLVQLREPFALSCAVIYANREQHQSRSDLHDGTLEQCLQRLRCILVSVDPGLL